MSDAKLPPGSIVPLDLRSLAPVLPWSLGMSTSVSEIKERVKLRLTYGGLSGSLDFAVFSVP